MEKAILKALIYSDLFEYPLKAWEIHKWLIGKKATLRQVEKTLRIKKLEGRIKDKEGYFFLKRRAKLVRQRKNREKISEKYFKQAKFVSFFLKIIPWIKLVGVSGSLSMMSASKSDDIDFFIITQRGRLWISRLWIILVLNLLNIRRKPSHSKKKSIGKICVNLLLDEDSLTLTDKNIYLAHEVLQMMPLWERDNIYSKYLEDNAWVFKYLPNWITSTSSMYHVSSIKYFKKQDSHNTDYIIHNTFNLLEQIAKWFQLKYMRQPKGMEKITETALYFHPEDKGREVLSIFKRKIAHLE